MRRWHADRRVTIREWREHRRNHVRSNLERWPARIGRDPDEVDCECDEQVGRFRKTDAYDCGRPRCGVCHGEKFYGKGRRRCEELADLRFGEQVREAEERR